MYTRIYKIIALVATLLGCHIEHENNMADTNSSGEDRAPQVRMIIFDLDGVLLRTSRTNTAKQLLRNVGPRIITQTNLQNRFFEWMGSVTQSDIELPYTAWDSNGSPLPLCMCHWLKGTTGYDSYSIIEHLTQALDDTSIPTSTYNAYKTLIHAVFDPHERARNTHLYKAGYRLLKRLQEAYSECTFAILSNYDATCFSHMFLKDELQRMFQRFDPSHIFISADIQTIKPDPAAFYHVCHACGVAPRECLFIDDQMVNVQTARDIGMQAICFGTDDTRDIYTLLNKE